MDPRGFTRVWGVKEDNVGGVHGHQRGKPRALAAVLGTQVEREFSLEVS